MRSFFLRFLIAPLLLLSLTVCTFGAGVYNDFVWDDIWQIMTNPWITSPAFLPVIFSSGVWDFFDFPPAGGVYYRPLMHVFFMAQYYFFGLEPLGYHAVNLFFHWLNATTLFVIVYLWLHKFPLRGGDWSGQQMYWYAFAASSLFLLHPVNSEVVYWIAALPELTYTFFFLVALGCFCFTSRLWLQYGLALLSFSIALLCKETALMLPPLLCLISFFFMTSPLKGLVQRSWSALLATAPFFGVAVAIFILRATILNPGYLSEPLNWEWGNFLLLTLGSLLEIVWYNMLLLLRLLPLSIFHNYVPGNPAFYGGVTLALGIAFIVMYRFRRSYQLVVSPTVVFGVLLLWLPLLPALNYFFLGRLVLSERYLYLPSMGFALLVAWFIFWVADRLHYAYVRGLWLLLSLGMIITLFVSESYQRVYDWKNTDTLFTAATRAYPDNPDPYFYWAQIACSLDQSSRCARLYETYCHRWSIGGNHEEYVACLNDPRYLAILAGAYLREGVWAKADEYYQYLLDQKPGAVEPLWGKGEVALSQGDLVRATVYLEQAYQAAPENHRVLVSRVRLFCQLGDDKRTNQSLTEAKQQGIAPEVLSLVLTNCLSLNPRAQAPLLDGIPTSP